MTMQTCKLRAVLGIFHLTEPTLEEEQQVLQLGSLLDDPDYPLGMIPLKIIQDIKLVTMRTQKKNPMK